MTTPTEKEIQDLKNWIQIWIINKEESEGWRRLMQKEFDEIGKEKEANFKHLDKAIDFIKETKE